MSVVKGPLPPVDRKSSAVAFNTEQNCDAGETKGFMVALICVWIKYLYSLFFFFNFFCILP